MKKYKLAASLISTQLIDTRSLLKSLRKNKIDQLHFDVMDGEFVPRIGLHPELLAEIKNESKIPVDIHLMINNPEKYIPTFIESGADIIFVHAESTNHLHRAIKMINDGGAKAGIAMNPATPLNVLDYVLDDVSFVMLMAINPGIVGHKIIPKTFDKIRDLRVYLGDRDIQIEIDGGVNFETAPKMLEAGADILVCGAQSIFKKGSRLESNVSALRKSINV